jgi:mannose-6-phosphate isomerase
MADGVMRIEPVARSYAWGSLTAIPTLLGQPPSARPVAELWFGAHSDSPSNTVDGPLDEAIAADPAGLLGPDVVARFGARLPFLLKLLAADRPLSIQVHPTLAQARAGYAAEQARGVALESPGRNYRDPYPKPELLCALTEFDALCGFRPVPDTIALLRALAVPALDPVLAALTGREPSRAAFELLLDLDDVGRAALLGSVLPACQRLAVGESEWTLAASISLRAAEYFPGDVGAVLTLLLNAVRLAPGEAIFLGAGNVHAYLYGLGVEIMANSDNVLRCGLTPKHVDVPEVLRVADFSALIQPRSEPVRSPGVVRFPVPVPDFELSVLSVPVVNDATATGPQILLCTEGAVTVGGIDLAPGQAVFVAAGRDIMLTGAGTVFRATAGD